MSIFVSAFSFTFLHLQLKKYILIIPKTRRVRDQIKKDIECNRKEVLKSCFPT
jgi:hypothetical protein